MGLGLALGHRAQEVIRGLGLKLWGIGLGSASGPQLREGPRNGKGKLEPEPL